MRKELINCPSQKLKILLIERYIKKMPNVYNFQIIEGEIGYLQKFNQNKYKGN